MYMELHQLIRELKYKRGWSFRIDYGWTHSNTVLQMSGEHDHTGSFVNIFDPLFFVVHVEVEDSNNPGKIIPNEFKFIAPSMPEEDSSFWKRWLINMILNVEIHEMCEFFQIGDDKPFYPEHGPEAGIKMFDIREKT